MDLCSAHSRLARRVGPGKAIVLAPPTETIGCQYYGGLPGDSQHERALRVLPDGCGAMLSFDVAGTVEQTNQFLGDLRLLTHATSLGGVETLIERRARYAGDATIASETLCRLSVGIEHVDDLWRDLDRSLRAALAMPT